MILYSLPWWNLNMILWYSMFGAQLGESSIFPALIIVTPRPKVLIWKGKMFENFTMYNCIFLYIWNTYNCVRVGDIHWGDRLDERADHQVDETGGFRLHKTYIEANSVIWSRQMQLSWQSIRRSISMSQLLLRRKTTHHTQRLIKDGYHTLDDKAWCSWGKPSVRPDLWLSRRRCCSRPLLKMNTLVLQSYNCCRS